MKKHKKKHKISREKAIYIVLIIIDAILIIYCANKNEANYAKLLGKKIYVGSTKNLLLGKNNVVLLITFFFVTYVNLIKKILLKHKIEIKNIILNIIVSLIFNCTLFYIFTNRIY